MATGMLRAVPTSMKSFQVEVKVSLLSALLLTAFHPTNVPPNYYEMDIMLFTATVEKGKYRSFYQL